MHMKKLVLIWLGMLGMMGGGYGQPTFSWRNDQNPTSGQWNVTNYWWDGFNPNLPGGSEILFLDGNEGTNMTNDLPSTNRFRISFGPLNATSRTINGAITNTFFDFGGQVPAIFNNSGVTHSINFPILNGNDKDANRLEINAANGGLNLGSTIAAAGGTRSLVAMGNSNISFSGVISNGTGTLNFLKEGIGTTTLSGANTYTGTTTISGGTLQLGAAERISNSSNLVLNGGTFRTGATSGFSETLGTLTLGANATITFGTSPHSLRFAASSTETWGNGLLTITGWTGIYNGASSGTNGRVFIGTDNLGLTASQLSKITFFNGTNYFTATQLPLTGEIVPTATQSPLYWGGTMANEWNTSNWSLTNSSPYTNPWIQGRTAIFNILNSQIAGAVATINAPTIIANESVTFTGNSGTFGTGSITTISVADGKTFDFGTQAVSSNQNFGIIKNGAGHLALAGNTYRGNFTLNEGTVIARGPNAMGSGNNALYINGGTIAGDDNRTFTAKFINKIFVANDFTFGSAVSPALSSANLTFTDSVVLGDGTTRTITIGGTGTYSLNGNISGVNSNITVNATAAGVLSLGGVNTYNGTTTVNGGTLRLSNASGFTIPGAVSLANVAGATLQINNNQTIGALSGGGATGGNISLGTFTLTTNSASTTTFSGIVSGTGGLTKSGTGMLRLESVNTYSGITTVTDGTLQLDIGNTINNSSTVIVTGGTLQLNASNAIQNAANLQLNGGSFRTGATTGFDETMGTLSLNSNSIIALGTGIHFLNFAASNALPWAGTQLTITGWAGGYSGTAGTAGRLYVGSNASGLTAGQLAKITFFNGTSYFGATQLADGEVVPTVIVSPTIFLNGILPNFGNVCTNAQSVVYSYAVSGINLTSNINITAPADFQISLSAGSGFGSSLNLSQTGGIVNSTLIYVRFIPGTTGALSQVITHTSNPAIQRNQTVNGTGLLTPADAGPISLTIDALPGENTPDVYNGQNRNFTIANAGSDSYEWTGFGYTPIVTNSNQVTFVVPCNAVAATVQVIPINNNGCRGASSPIFNVTINPIGAASFTTPNPANVCSGATSTHTILNVSAALTYNWSVANGTYLPNSNPGVNRSAIDVTWNATATDLPSTINVTPRINACTGPTTTFNVLLYGTSNGGTANATTVCLGGASTLSLSGQTANAYQWQRSNDNVTFNNITGATSSTYITPPLSFTNYYRAVVTNGVCASATSLAATVPISQANLSNADFSASWTNGQNDGTTGFGAWSLTSTGGGGFFTGSSDVNNNNTRSWGLFAGGTGAGNAANAVRPVFLGVGNTLAFSMDNGSITNGNTIGFSLRNAANQSLMEFVFVGGATNYTLNDGTGTGFSTGVGYTTAGLDVRITYSALNTYSISITPKGGTTTVISNRTFTPQAGGQVPAEIRMFNAGAGSGPGSDLFFNSLGINNPAITTQPLATAQSQCVGAPVTPLTVAAGGTGNTFQWFSNTVNNTYAGSTNLGSGSGAQTNSYTPQNAITGTLYYFCLVTGPCGSTYTRYSGSVTIGAPSTPGAITQTNPGGTSVCSGASGVNYSIASVPGATAYNWSVPSNASITAGSGTTSITVNWGTATSGNVTVNAQNGLCATSPNSTLSITVSPIPAAPSATSPQTFCGSPTVADLTASGTGIQWYAASTGGTALAGTTALVSGNTYHASQMVSGCESARTSVSVILTTSGTYVGPNNGDWNTPANWCGGVPTSVTNAIIPLGLTVNIGTANAVANSVTINGGLGFSGSSSYSLTISANGTLTNNGTFTRGIGTLSFAGAGTVNGSNGITLHNLTINTETLTLTTRPTIDGTLRLNGGNISTNAPIYTSLSTLSYGTSYTRFLEWSATGTGTIGTTPGYPNHVVIDAGTFNVLNSDAGTARALAGNLTVNTGATFTTGNLNAVLTVGGNMITNGTGAVNLAGTNAAMAVVGSVTTNGSITLSSVSGGNLNVGGNFTKTGGTWNGNGRELIFNGTGTQAFISNDNITIQTLRNSNVSLNTVFINSSLTIGSGGGALFNTSGNRTTVAAGATITFSDGTTLATTNGITTILGNMVSAGFSGLTTVTNTSAASLVFGATGTFNLNTTCNGIGISPVPLADWQTGSLCSITGLTSPTAGSWPSGTAFPTVSFSNFTWNTPGLTTNPNMGGLTIQVNGTFSLISTGVSSEIRLTTGGTGIINTNNFSQSGGIINMAAGAGVGTINCSGSFNRIGGTITESSNGSGNINFIGSGLQNVTPGTNINNLINFRCNKSANGISISGTLPINEGATFFRSQGTVTGTISYNATNSTLAYDGNDAIVSSDGEWPTTNGPVNVTINNIAGVTLHANRSLISSGILNLTSGIFTTTGTTLTINNTAVGAINQAVVSSYINGPLDRATVAATTYAFPIGKGSAYLPATLQTGTGSSTIRFEAFNTGSGGSPDGTLNSISTTEYWQGTIISGTLSSASLSLGRTSIGSFTAIGRNLTTVNGAYGSIGGVVAGNSITNAFVGNSLGYFVLGISVPIYYWSNATSMNWSTAANWRATTTPVYTAEFIPSVVPSAENSAAITIRSGHTVTIDVSSSLDQTIIEASGTLVKGNADLIINNGLGTDLEIQNGGIFRHSTTISSFNNATLISGSTIAVRSGGIVDITSNVTGASDYGTATNFTYETNSIFNWSINNQFASSGLTFFPNAGEGVIPIFRLSTNITNPVGGGSPTIINGLFEANGDISWQLGGTKTFRNGIIGTGTVTQNASSGTFLINGTTSRLGGTGAIIINATNGLVDISNGTCTLESNKTITSASGGRIRLSSAASTFNAQTFALSGTAGYEHTVAGSTLITANAAGVNGSIGSLSGAKSFVNGVNYTFNGITDQVTGTLMGNTAGTITINNTGVTNNTVTLSNTGTNTANLTLTGGRFATGAAANELRILSGGTINATAGDFVTGAGAGTIFFNTIGGGSFSGNANPYNVRIQGPVNFGAGIVTIQNGGNLRIDQNGGVTDFAPFYAAGSTLQYSTNGLFNRFLEWNSTSGRGNPHHVLISNSTLLSAARGDASYAATPFVTNGNLSIENLSSLYMDYNGQNMTIPLQIGGDLLLEGNLSGSGATGGDIKLAGNWTRSSTGAFFPNNRAVFFTGNGNTQVIMNTSPVAANRIETFPYFIVDKTGGDVQLSSTPTTNVLVNGASGNVLEILNGNIDLHGNVFELGGGAGIFRVNGASQKRVYSNTPAVFRVIGYKEIVGTNAGNLLFDDLVTVEIAAGLNFGLNNLNIHVTTINATLQINPGGYADVFAPYYGPNGILVYNTGGTNYLRRVEWRGEAGEPGYPNDVIIQANTTVYAGGPNAGESVNNALSARRDVTIQAGSSLNMSGTYNMTRDLIVGRNLTINGNLTNSTNAGIDVFVGKDWTRGASGSFTNLNNGAVFFNTNQPGTISYAGGTETFPFLIVDKAGSVANTITLNSPVNVLNKFTLSSGRVITKTNVLSITNPLTDDAGNGVAFIDGSQGYVDGPLRRNVQNTTGENSYTFPVGTLAGGTHFIKRFRLRDVSESASPNYFSAEYLRAAPPLDGASNYLFQDELLGIHKDEYWNINREAGTAKGRLVLPYTNPGALGWLLSTVTPTSPPTDANVAIVKGNGGGVYNFTDPGTSGFVNMGTEPEAIYYTINGDVRSRLISTFSPFTFGYGYNSILPIKLLTFTATLQNGSGLLHWKIADAKDLRQFEVEHSTDGQRFNRIGTVMPNGGLSFSYINKNLTTGIHYYRLRMVEKDGQASFSKTEIIQVGRQQTYITGLQQNPVIGGQAIVQVNSAVAQHAEAVLLDAIGRMLLRQKVQLMAGPNNVNLTVLPLPAGTYRILFRTQDGVEKVMPMMK